MKKNILAIVILLIAVAGWYAFKMYGEKTPDIVNKKPDVIISATNLLDAFNKDSAAAVKKYVDKIIEVTGNVKKADSSAIVLGDRDSESSIVCGVDRRHIDDYKKIKIGSPARLQGNCTGYEKGEEMLGMNLGTTVHLSFAGVKEKNR